MPNFESLPWNIKENVGLSLNYIDVCHLMQSCRAYYDVLSQSHFWYRYLLRNTSLSIKPDRNRDFRELFKEHYRGRYKRAAIDMNVVWLNDTYLKRKRYVDSFKGSIIKLLDVCWLDLSTVFEDVDPGVYHVVWRMRSSEDCLMSGDTYVGAKWDDEKEETTVSEESWSHTRKWVKWHCIKITVKKRTGVQVYMYNHSSHWKSGLFWDYVQLLPEMAGSNALRVTAWEESH